MPRICRHEASKSLPGTARRRCSRAGGRWELAVDGQVGAFVQAPVVVAALAGRVLERLVELPAGYRAILGSIPYRGIVCVLLALREPLSPFYWTNVTDRLGLGCVGIIEHTNLVDAARYGGQTLVYLAHYVDPSDPAWSATPDELVDGVEDVLRTLNPRFQRDWVTDLQVARDRFAQPIPLAGGPMRRLTVRTGLPGLYHASLAHIYPDDRGVSKALWIGREAALPQYPTESTLNGGRTVRDRQGTPSRAPWMARSDAPPADVET